MKRHSLITLLLAISSFASADVVKVYNGDDFMDAMESNQDMVLMDDIDMKDIDWTVDKYSGEISGLKENVKDGECAYYTIKNSNKMWAEKMDGAYIHNLIISDCKIKCEGSKWGCVALLCKSSTNCKFDELALSNISSDAPREGVTDYLKFINDGACIAAYDDGSSFSNILVYNSSVYIADQRAGLLVAQCKNSTFTNCASNPGCSVYSGGLIENSTAGGFVGWAENSTFTKCYNYGLVAGKNDRVGGIIGGGKNCKMEKCNNYGPVLSKEFSTDSEFDKAKAGLSAAMTAKGAGTTVLDSFAGEADITATFNKIPLREGCVKMVIRVVTTNEFFCLALRGYNFYTSIVQLLQFIYDHNGSDEVGGIVGNLAGGTIRSCSNYGFCYCGDAYGGGIVGIAQNDEQDMLIENCVNQGYVRGDEQTGGIVGALKSGAIKTCLNVGTIDVNPDNKDNCGLIYGNKHESTTENNFFSSLTTDEESAEPRGVNQQMLASGEVACMLNTKSGTDVWHQTIGTDFFPTLNDSSDVVTENKIDKNIEPIIETDNSITFLGALVNPYSHIKLTDDIDLNSDKFNLSSKYMPFCGVIDGNNHRIANINYTLTTYGKGDQSLGQENVALLPYANGATFKDLELTNFVINNGDIFGNYIGMLVANSENCIFQNVKLTGKSHFRTPTWDIGGMCIGGLVGTSKNDVFRSCSVGSNCEFYTNGEKLYDAHLGGLVGVATGSKFIYCINQASVAADDDVVGGIVGNAEESEFFGCLNAGHVRGDDKVGGIVGYDKNTSYLLCENLGDVTASKYIDYDAVAGIIGSHNKNKDGNAGTVDYCFNYGNMTNDGDADPILGNGNSKTYTNCKYHCTIGGKKKDNFDEDNDKVLTGEYAYTFDSKNTIEKASDYDPDINGHYLYQDIDNNTFFTPYPVPIKDAGVVYQNTQCDGTKDYGNKFKSDSSHDPQPNAFGYCTVCGRIVEHPETVDINSGDDLRDLSYAVDAGQTFKTVNIMSDIDLSGSNWCSIGTQDHPFSGTVKGHAHYIKNMTVNMSDGYSGLFGCVTDATFIDSLFIDSTCVVSGVTTGSGSFIGGITSKDGSECKVSLTCCGNDADVKGYGDVGGLVGGVYDNTNTELVIDRCYNTGEVNGITHAAGIVGFGGRRLTIKDSWNCGDIIGADEGKSFARYYCNDAQIKYTSAKTVYLTGTDLLIDNCYNTVNQDGINTLTLEDMLSGRLCDEMKYSPAYPTYWFQNLNTQGHAMPISAGNDTVYCNVVTTCTGAFANYYSNTFGEFPSNVHFFNDKGICTAKKGEIHGEEPEEIDGVRIIKNAGNLYWIANKAKDNNFYNCRLEADIVVNEDVIQADTLNTDPATLANHLVWTPISWDHQHSEPYVFDGNNHTISGLYCVQDDAPAGLFGDVTKATVKNLGVIDSYFKGNHSSGSIIGIIYLEEGSEIKNCFSTGIVTGKENLGGLVGSMYGNGVKIENCYSYTSVMRDGNDGDINTVGGLIGNITKHVGDDYIQMTAEEVTCVKNCYYQDGKTNGKAPYGVNMPAYNFANGVVCDLLNTDNAGVWCQAIESQSIPHFGDQGITYQRNVSYSWGNIVMPFTLTSNTDVQYYVIDSLESATSTLYIKPVESIEPNHPCFFSLSDYKTLLKLKAASGTLVDPQTPTPSVMGENTKKLNLVGTYATEKISAPDLSGAYNYKMMQVALWNAHGSTYIPAFQAYLYTSGAVAEGPEYIIFGFSSPTSGLKDASVASPLSGKALYNISGQRITKPARQQIYILDNRKYLQR